MKAGANIEHIFVVEEYFEKVAGLANVTVVSPEIMQDLTDSKTPQG